MVVELLESDPDLARYVGEERFAAARRELVAETAVIRRGEADLAAMAPGGLPAIGLLILDGLVERDVVVADTISAELIGPGDTDAESLRLLLRAVFAACGGTHDDWDAYDRAMADERRTVVLIAPTRSYGNGP